MPGDRIVAQALTPQPLERASGTGNVVALTFDDGPNGAVTESLLDFLREHAIRAVFCVVGRSILADGGADVLRRIVDDGHVLGNHTTTFADLGAWGPAEVRADLEENLTIIRDALRDSVATVPYFRAPNGNWGDSAAAAVSLGMQPLAVINTIDDWNTQDPLVLESNLRRAMTPGELVVMHDGGGDRWGTIAAVQRVVRERLAQGWRFTLPLGS